MIKYIKLLFKSIKSTYVQINELEELLKSVKALSNSPYKKTIKMNYEKFAIDVKTSGKKWTKEAIRHLKKMGFEVIKRKEDITPIQFQNYLKHNSDRFEYYKTIFTPEIDILTLPQDWNKLIEYTKKEDKLSDLEKDLIEAEKKQAFNDAVNAGISLRDYFNLFEDFKDINMPPYSCMFGTLRIFPEEENKILKEENKDLKIKLEEIRDLAKELSIKSDKFKKL